MGWLSSALDWCADKVQTVTGEKERRVLVEQFKEMYDDFKFMVKQKVEEINEKIKEFNSFIQKINLLRKNQIEPEIVRLGGFLGKFGNTKSIGAYAEEREKYEITLPEQQYEIIENYIFEIDWSQGEVFNNTFFLTPIGMTMKTKQQNLSMRERLNDFRLEIDETLSQLGIKKDEIEQNCRIAELYIFCVEFIADYIARVILPELDVVEAFFQTLCLKNVVLAEQAITNIKFINNLEIIQDTQYQKHFLFVINTFMFYVIACKIYTTPILTKLLNNEVIVAEDIEIMEENKKVLLGQKDNVDKYLMFNRSV